MTRLHSSKLVLLGMTALLLGGCSSGGGSGSEENKPPVAHDDDAGVVRTGESITIDVLINDEDPNGKETLDPETLTITAQPSKGSAVVEEGKIVYSAPSEPGETSFTYTVEDNQGAVSNEATVTITISGTAPTFESTPVESATQGKPYSYEIKVYDPDDPPETLDIKAPEKPDWLTLTTFTNNTDYIAILQGTPGPGDVAIHPVELTLTDPEGQTAKQTFSIEVKNTNDPPAFTSEPVTTATEGTPYQYDVTASDPDKDSLVFSLTSPAQPTWLTLTDNKDGTATLTGTPDNGNDVEVALTVSDGTVSVTQTFTIAVTPTASGNNWDEAQWDKGTWAE